MKLCVKRLFVLSYLFHASILVGVMHEMEPVDIAEHHLDGSDYGPVDGGKTYDPAVIDAASSTHDGYIDQGQADLLQPVDRGQDSMVRVDDLLPGQVSSSSEISVVDQRSSALDQFEDVPLNDQPTTPDSPLAPKSKVQRFIDSVKELWSNFWKKLTGRKSGSVPSGVESASLPVEDVQPLTVDQRTQLRDLALQDPSNFAAATAQTIAEKVGQAAKELRDAVASTDPKAHQEALSYVEATYEPLQLTTKTLNDLSSYVSDPKKFDFVKQQNVETQYLSEHTFFPADSAAQRDLYTQLGKEVLQPRDGVYGASSNASELAYAYRRNQAKQMIANNPAWPTALKLTQGSSLGVDAQGNIVVRSASGKEQSLTDAQYASLGQAYAQELPDASLSQQQLLHLARAKGAAAGTPADIQQLLGNFVSCVGNDFYYGDLVTFQKTGQQPVRDSLRPPVSSDLQRVVTARKSLERDYQQAKSAIAGA